MIQDLIEYLRAPYPWHLAPMGYVRELSGLARRAEQCADAWRPHLEATRRHIEAAVQGCKGQGTVLVVGSGLLLDVPIYMLSDRFRRVVLADIFHARQVRRVARDLANVELLQADITGVVEPAYDYARRRQTGPLPRGRPGLPNGEAFDAIVSVNLLSQLAPMPRQYIKAHRPAVPPKALHEFSKRIVEQHLAWLRRLRGQTVLIADYQREEQRNDGIMTCSNILEGIRLPEADASWAWDIAPLGSVYRDIEVRHRVAAYWDFGGQSAAAAPIVP